MRFMRWYVHERVSPFSLIVRTSSTHRLCMQVAKKAEDPRQWEKRYRGRGASDLPKDLACLRRRWLWREPITTGLDLGKYAQGRSYLHRRQWPGCRVARLARSKADGVIIDPCLISINNKANYCWSENELAQLGNNLSVSCNEVHLYFIIYCKIRIICRYGLCFKTSRIHMYILVWFLMMVYTDLKKPCNMFGSIRSYRSSIGSTNNIGWV